MSGKTAESDDTVIDGNVIGCESVTKNQGQGQSMADIAKMQAYITALVSHQTKGLHKLQDQKEILRQRLKQLRIDIRDKEETHLNRMSDDRDWTKLILRLIESNRTLRLHCHSLQLDIEYHQRKGTDEDESQQWQCYRCTSANHPWLIYCELCNSDRYDENDG